MPDGQKAKRECKRPAKIHRQAPAETPCVSYEDHGAYRGAARPIEELAIKLQFDGTMVKGFLENIHHDGQNLRSFSRQKGRQPHRVVEL
jgi:hypothetical protein